MNCSPSGKIQKCSQYEIEEYSIPTLDLYGDDSEDYRSPREYIFKNRYAVDDCYETCLQKFTCVAFLHDRNTRECRLLNTQCELGGAPYEEQSKGKHKYYSIYDCPLYIRQTLIVAAVCGGTGLILLVLFLDCMFCCWCRRGSCFHCCGPYCVSCCCDCCCPDPDLTGCGKVSEGIAHCKKC